MKALKDALTEAFLREGTSDCLLRARINERRTDYVDGVTVDAIYRDGTPLKQMIADRNKMWENHFRLINSLYVDDNYPMVYIYPAEEHDGVLEGKGEKSLTE